MGHNNVSLPITHIKEYLFSRAVNSSQTLCFFIQGTKHLQPKGVASSKNEYRAETARRYIGQNVFVFCKLQKHV